MLANDIETTDADSGIGDLAEWELANLGSHAVVLQDPIEVAVLLQPHDPLHTHHTETKGYNRILTHQTLVFSLKKRRGPKQELDISQKKHESDRAGFQQHALLSQPFSVFKAARPAYLGEGNEARRVQPEGKAITNRREDFADRQQATALVERFEALHVVREEVLHHGCVVEARNCPAGMC